MADDANSAAAPIRLMTFVSQEELEQSKKARGERVEDGTAQRDRPLYEILRENKDKKDLEFNERFKHRPPKALDEDETEFLDSLQMSRKEHERQVADEEEQELQRFRKAVEEAQNSSVRVIKEVPPPPKLEDPNVEKKKSQPPRPLGGLVIAPKLPPPKKAKLAAGATTATNSTIGDVEKSNPESSLDAGVGSLGALVSYGDESEED